MRHAPCRCHSVIDLLIFTFIEARQEAALRVAAARCDACDARLSMSERCCAACRTPRVIYYASAFDFCRARRTASAAAIAYCHTVAAIYL